MSLEAPAGHVTADDEVSGTIVPKRQKETPMSPIQRAAEMSTCLAHSQACAFG